MNSSYKSFNSWNCRNWLVGEIYANSTKIIFETLQDDTVFKSGKNWDNYSQLTRDELLLLSNQRQRALSQALMRLYGGLTQIEFVLSSKQPLKALTGYNFQALAVYDISHEAGQCFSLNKNVCIFSFLVYVYSLFLLLFCFFNVK